MTLAAPPAVDDCWHTLTVTAQTDAEARKAATDCARAINTSGVTALRVSIGSRTRGPCRRTRTPSSRVALVF